MSSPNEARHRLPGLATTPDGNLDLALTAELAVIEQHRSGVHRLVPGAAVIRVGDGESAAW